MELVVLVDNNTTIDEYYLGEPGVCYYLEDEGEKILLDTGYSDVLIKNAKALDIDMTQVSIICLSHGHNDHTRGLQFLQQQNLLYGKKIVAHPGAFYEKKFENETIGAPFEAGELAKITSLKLSKSPVRISENLIFLGEIPEMNQFEKRKVIGKEKVNGSWQEDLVMDDSALVYQGRDGLTIITGCSHSGICNMIEYAKKVCNEDRVFGVIGGFHLFETDWQLLYTISYFEEHNIRNLYPCHCVSFEVKAEIHKRIPIHSVGVGMRITFA